jgi:hypothetical protein
MIRQILRLLQGRNIFWDITLYSWRLYTPVRTSDFTRHNFVGIATTQECHCYCYNNNNSKTAAIINWILLEKIREGKGEVGVKKLTLMMSTKLRVVHRTN